MHIECVANDTHDDYRTRACGSLRFRPFSASHWTVPLLLPLLRDGQIPHGQWHHPPKGLAPAAEEDLHRLLLQLTHGVVSSPENGIPAKQRKVWDVP